ncbi:MAG: WG repeat-containing protein [Phycisphaerae bacterium]|nr:WG repeat-containing protein [Phycisphaerae bacterium]
MLRKFLLIAVLLFCAGCKKASPPAPPPPPQDSAATAPASMLLPVVQDEQWGYINADGKIVISPQYQDAGVFSEGLAAVQSKGLWGFVDATGRMVISPQFEAVDQGGFSAGRVGVMLNGQWGLIDAAGKTILPPESPTPLRFHENLAVIRNGNLFGYIDVNGQVVVKPQYSFAGPFSEGLAVVMTHGKWMGRRVSDGFCGYIDKTGQLKIPDQYRAAGPFSEGLAWVQYIHLSKKPIGYDQPYRCSYINNLGKVVIFSKDVPDVLAGRPFHENLAAVRSRQNGLWGFIDKSGLVVIEADFDRVSDFHEGLAAVLTFPGNGEGGVKWGYIDPEGQVVIQPRFDRAGDFRQGVAAVWADGKLGYIGRDGRFLWPPAK